MIELNVMFGMICSHHSQAVKDQLLLYILVGSFTSLPSSEEIMYSVQRLRCPAQQQRQQMVTVD